MGGFVSGFAGSSGIGSVAKKVKGALKSKKSSSGSSGDPVSSDNPYGEILYHHGGKVRAKRGIVKKGEFVMTKGQQRGSAKSVRKQLRSK